MLSCWLHSLLPAGNTAYYLLASCSQLARRCLCAWQFMQSTGIRAHSISAYAIPAPWEQGWCFPVCMLRMQTCITLHHPIPLSSGQAGGMGPTGEHILTVFSPFPCFCHMPAGRACLVSLPGLAFPACFRACRACPLSLPYWWPAILRMAGVGLYHESQRHTHVWRVLKILSNLRSAHTAYAPCGRKAYSQESPPVVGIPAVVGRKRGRPVAALFRLARLNLAPVRCAPSAPAVPLVLGAQVLTTPLGSNRLPLGGQQR